MKSQHKNDIQHHSHHFPPPASRENLVQELHQEAEDRRTRIDKDFSNGFNMLSNYSNTVTMFGSARFAEGHPYYEKAREIGAMLADQGYTVITGGGGGIMEGGNRGAFEASGSSIGFNIELPQEQSLNPYTTASLPFRYFFTRKVMLAFSAHAYIYFPGGFGTLDEFFEILTLIQTKKVEKAPIICVGYDFWKPLDGYIQDQLLEGFHTISPDDEKLYTITEDLEVISQILSEHQRNTVAQILSGNSKDD